jgi:hypothetical protein
VGDDKILPGTGRGTAGVAGGGGGGPQTDRLRPTSSVSLRLPPPRPGEEFAGNATRLAGHAGILFGWTPDIFWSATPAELAALVNAAAGERPAPVDLAALMEAFPDG